MSSEPITDEMVEAADDAWLRSPHEGKEQMRDALTAALAVRSQTHVWRKMTADELRALPPNGSFPALAHDPDLKHVGLPCDPWSLPPEDIAAMWFMPVPTPPLSASEGDSHE